ncbi:MAG TPA: arylamine N-acetyltransferase [Terriglobales bacterium]|nr:arylamine N-acetyltransferase [Terriglobales bacterium]
MDVAAYLERIGYEGSPAPTLDTLRAVHRRHMLTVPFENLDIHLGRTIVLDEAAFFDKIVRQHRGGFCYELNGLFAALLRQLGYEVDLLSGRVANEIGRFGPEFDHLVLRVRLDGQPWIADVGFGDSFVDPLALEGGEQSSGGMMYFIDSRPEGLIVLRKENGAWSAKYVFTLQPHRLEEFAGMCVYHQTSPNSTFPRARICTRATPQGRITLSEMRLIQTMNGERTERMLESEEQYQQALLEYFGIEMPNLDWKPLRQW